MKMSPRRFSWLLRVVPLLLMGLPHSLWSQTTSWTAGGGNTSWSTNANWSTSASPASTFTVFGNSGATASTGTSSIVDGNYTINSLTFNNTGTITGSTWQTLNILSGNTVTVNSASSPTNSLTVGGMNGNSINTYASISGSGALAVSGSSILIGNTAGNASPANTSTGELDLSKLATFTANLGTTGTAAVRVGLGTNTQGIFYLAQSNTITAAALSVGDTNASAAGIAAGTPTAVSNVYLGKTNTLNLGTLAVGAPTGIDAGGNNTLNNDSGMLQFQNGLTGATVVLRGQTGTTSRAEFTIGANTVGTTTPSMSITTSLVGVADFTGGSVDALVDKLIIGETRQGATANIGASGTLSMNAGTFDATTVSVGISNGSANINAAAFAKGTINVSGGTFTAGSMTIAKNSTADHNVFGDLNISGSGSMGVTGNIILGSNVLGSASGTVQANISLTGGSLSVGGNIAEDASSLNTASTITLNGGSLDLDGGAGGSPGSITVDTLNLQSGTLKNLAEFNSGGTLNKTTTGALTLTGNNSYTGLTAVTAGVVSAQSNTALGSTSAGTVVSNNATLQLQGGVSIGAEALTVSGTGASGQTGAFVNAGGTNSYAGAVTLGADATISSASGSMSLTNTGTISGGGFNLTVGGSGNGSIAATIGTGAGGLTKLGSGSWILSGTSTYTGATTISAGSLLVSGGLSSSTALTVTGSATLGLGKSAGAAGFKTLTVSSVDVGSAGSESKIAMTLGTAGNDELIASGTLTLNNSQKLNLVLTDETWTGSTSALVGPYTLMNWISSNFTDPLTQLDLAGSSPDFSLSEFSIQGNSLIFTVAAPEPSTWALLGLGLVAGQVWRSQRRKAA